MGHDSGDVFRARILAAAETFYHTYHVWPTRRPLAGILGVSKEVIRYHVNLLIEAGLMRRNADGTLQVLRNGDPIHSVRPVALDYMILKYVAEEIEDGGRYATTGDILARIPPELRVPRHILSRRCTILVAQGKLVKRGRGYRLPDPQK